MKFLLFQNNQTEKRPSQSSNNDSSTGNSQHTQSICSAENHHNFARPIRTKRNMKRKRDEDDKKEEEAFHFLKVAANELTSKDEFTIFGQMVASQIRKLNRRNQAIAKNRIQNCLFELEMEEMNNVSSYETSTPGSPYFSSSSSASPHTKQSSATCSEYSQTSTPQDQNTAVQEVQEYFLINNFQ